MFLQALKGFSTISKASLTPRKVAKIIAELASDKKAEDIEILDMRKLVNFCDYFVLCSGNTDRHTRAIAEGISEGLDELGIEAHFKKDTSDQNWIVFDTGATVVHIFQKRTREFYRLEYLWQEAKKINWQK